jgi:hypothetical protein
MHAQEAKVVYLVADAGAQAPRAHGVLRHAFLERVPLDADGLERGRLSELGFGEQHPGMAMIWLRDPAAAAALGRLGELQVTTEEHVFIERAEPAIEIAAYSHRLPSLTRGEFQHRYTLLGERLRDGGGLGDLLCRYAQSHVLSPSGGPDAVGELGFASAQALTRFIADPRLFDELLPYEAQFLDHSRTVQLIARRR